MVDSSKYDRNARAERDLGLPEFEDLYYFLACKARGLYADLQVRYASGFIAMDTLLYGEKDRKGKPNTLPQVPCTVSHIRNMIRSLWFMLLHRHVKQTLEAAINKRKYQHLKAHPLVPRMLDEDSALNKHLPVGRPLDEPMLSVMFQHLEDVSKVSIPELLNKIDRRTRTCQVPLARIEAPATRDAEKPDRKIGPWRSSRISLNEDEENNIEQEAELAELSSEDEIDEQRQPATTLVRPPPRTTSLLPTAALAPQLPLTSQHNEGIPLAAVKGQKWLQVAAPSDTSRSPVVRTVVPIRTPPVSPLRGLLEYKTTYLSSPVSPMGKTCRSNDSHLTSSSPSSKFSRETRSTASYGAFINTTPSSKYSQSGPPTTPSNTITSPTITTSLPSRRLPFHENDEYVPPLPPLPPKSAEQIAAAAQAARAKELRERQMRNENQKLKRENSQLQEALQQFQAQGRMQRENSQLQDALEQVQARERVQREDLQMQEAMQHSQGQEPKLKREPSGLREALQHIQQTPGGLMRRLSKAGSRARSRSPFKSSRKSLANSDAECRQMI